MREAGVMIIIKDGLILAVSRKDNKSIFGLPGGKKDSNDFSTLETAIRETAEETSIIVKKCVFVYQNAELAKSPDGRDYYSRCYFATEWSGSPHNNEGCEVKWLTLDELCNTKAAFGSYNKNSFAALKQLFPNLLLK